MRLPSRSRYREWSKHGVLDVENLPKHLIQLVHVDGGVQSLPHDVTLQRSLRRPDTTFEHAKSYSLRCKVIEGCHHTNYGVLLRYSTGSPRTTIEY